MFDQRKYTIITAICILGLIYISRLFYLQVLDKEYVYFAEENALQKKIITPARGLIYDRNGNILVTNETVYDIMVIPSQVKPFDTVAFARLLNIKIPDIRKKLAEAEKYSRYKPSLFLRQLSIKSYGKLQERLYEFRGFYAKESTTRKYPYKTAPHVLGYLGEVEQDKIDNSDYYKLGDYIGISGLEKEYENLLRGEKGVEHVLVDVLNREQGTYLNGELDKPAKAGFDIVSTIDVNLQQYGEKLMQNKKGSIVAIEPSTGEILAMVNSPSYDPNLLIGRNRAKNYARLQNDENKPLFNRATSAMYPPGSTFKLVQALIGLDEGVIDENTKFSCHGGYFIPGLKVGCHHHKSPVSLEYSIVTSCNAYYCNVFRYIIDQDKFKNTAEAYDHWRKKVASFGMGVDLQVDLPSEKDGILYTSQYYDNLYGENRWKSPTIISLAIGQAEVSLTPLQLANFVSVIANHGYYVTPHLLKGVVNRNITSQKLFEKHYADVDTSYFPFIVEAMYQVVERGTGRWYAKVNGIDICGKTGTSQNPHGEDHSIFIAFAPKDHPKIAVATVVENAGFGSTWAAPIASLMIEKYLTDTITRPRIEQRILEGDFITKEDTTKNAVVENVAH